MRHKRNPHLSLWPYLTLICCAQLYAETLSNIASQTSLSLGAASSNLVVDQTYLNNYYEHTGHAKLQQYTQSLQLPLSTTGEYNALLDVRNIYMPDINTNVAGFNFVYRTQFPSGDHIGIFAGADYTHYDQLYFTQAVFGAETRIYELDATTTFMIPFGPGQNYANLDASFAADGANLTGLYGAEIHAVKTLDNFDYIFQTSTHWHYNTKNQFTGVALGLNFHWHNLTLGTLGQYRNGLDDDIYGGKVFANIALANKTKRTLPKRIAGIERQYGAAIDAEEFNCAPGFNAYSAYGINTCSDTNPASGINLTRGSNTPMSGAKLKSGVDFETSSIQLDSDSPIVFEKGIHILNNLYYVFPDVVIKPGAIILFANESGLIIDPSAKITIGASGQGDPVTLASAPFFKYHLLQAASGSKSFSGYQQALRGFSASKDITGDATSDLFPIVGILMTGKSRLDLKPDMFNNSKNFSSISKLGSAATGTDASVGFDTTISLYPLTGDDTLAGGANDLVSRNSIIRTRSYAVPIESVATNLVIDEFQSISSNRTALSITGGQLSMRNSILVANANTPTLLSVSAGAQTTVRDSVFDLALSKSNTPAIQLSHFGNSVQSQYLTGLSVEYSLFKGAKGNSATTGTSAFINTPTNAPNNTSDSGNGFTLSLLNNTFDARRFPSTLEAATSSNSTNVAGLASDAVFSNANSNPASSLPNTIALYGNTLLYNSTYLDDTTNANKDNLMQVLTGMGQVIKPTSDGNNYPNNNINMINTGSGTDIGAMRIDTQATLSTGISSSGSWYGSSSDAGHNNATFNLLRALDTPYQTRQTTGLLAKNDPLSLNSTNNPDGSSRSPMIATRALDSGLPTVQWEARAGSTSETSAYGVDSDSLIRKMRQAEQLHDLQLQDYLRSRIQDQVEQDGWNQYNNGVIKNSAGSVIDPGKA